MGQLPWVLHLGNGGEFSPPVWGIHQVGLQIQPYFHISDGWLRQVTASSPDVWIGHSNLPGMHHLSPLGWWGNPMGPFCMHPKRMFPGFSVGASTYIRLYFWFQKSHLPLQPMPAWGTSGTCPRTCTSGSFHCGCRGMDRGILYPQLSVSMSHSNMWAASSTCWWASLASHRPHHAGLFCF